MSNKKKRKLKKHFGIYRDQAEIDEMKYRPYLYKQQDLREQLDRHFYNLIKNSNVHRYAEETRIKGLNKKYSREIALATWLR